MSVYWLASPSLFSVFDLIGMTKSITASKVVMNLFRWSWVHPEDKKQSERFKEAARQLGADENSEAFDRVLKELAPTKDRSKK